MNIFRKKIAVVEIDNIPPSCTGAPMPIVVSDEHRLAVIYILNDQTGLTVQDDVPRPRSVGDVAVCALITFERVQVHKFGVPNDEALDGHPLYKHGLGRYGFFEVTNSPWIDELCKQNSVHIHHSDSMFADYRHYVFTFHDSTFEAVAKEFNVEILGPRSLNEVAIETVESWRE